MGNLKLHYVYDMLSANELPPTYVQTHAVHATTMLSVEGQTEIRYLVVCND